ncbi:MAG: acyl-CoA synthetase FdrA [Candidatus Promineofilum sp.]|nr:acyl-CoA synthetase FdrA [Promineifilum sp.]
MPYTKYQIRSGAYYDSVTLMQLQKALVALPGVADAGVMMATPANCELLTASGFDLATIEARPDDLLLIIKAETETAAADALAQVDSLLKQRQTTTTQGFRPRSLRGGVDQLAAAEWVLLSIPGRYAADVAEEALDLGRHVFLFSDHVTLDEEVRLKQKAIAKGLLVMGPDCGTAIINGVGLGFANYVRRGNIGIVAASGTGLQAAATEIHELGGGISQAIGIGGRDLKSEIGGKTALQALDWLARDEATTVILLISKPPAAEVVVGLLRAAQGCGKPVVCNFIGYPPPGRRLGNLTFASGLSDAAALSVGLSQNGPPKGAEAGRPLSGYVRGLFSGGTLAYEMLLGLEPVLTPLYSNLTVDPDRKLNDLTTSQAHTILDLGDDAFTQGRLHPMMDNELRLRRLAREIADAEVDLLILDVVLGAGAHPDPAAELAPALDAAVQAGKRVVAIVIGTEEDPQKRSMQIDKLTAVGAVVFTSASGALDYIYGCLPPVEYAHPSVSFATDGLSAINVGLESFYESIVAQDGTAVHVAWQPPAGGDERLMRILARLKKQAAVTP